VCNEKSKGRMGEAATGFLLSIGSAMPYSRDQRFNDSFIGQQEVDKTLVDSGNLTQYSIYFLTRSYCASEAASNEGLQMQYPYQIVAEILVSSPVLFWLLLKCCSSFKVRYNSSLCCSTPTPGPVEILLLCRHRKTT